MADVTKRYGGTSAATETTEGVSERATNAEALTGTDTERHVTPANLKYVLESYLKPPAPVAFAGSAGYTITHNYGHTDYQVIINPVADPGGFLGRVWINKSANTAVIYNSGSAKTNFDYVIIPAE